VALAKLEEIPTEYCTIYNPGEMTFKKHGGQGASSFSAEKLVK
jgi:hypothetical protein